MVGDQPIGMPVLAMRPASPNLLEAKAYQERCHLSGLRNRHRIHWLRDSVDLNATQEGHEAAEQQRLL